MSDEQTSPEIWWKSLYNRWMLNRHTDNAAAIAFYGLMSLVPILLVGVTVAGMVLGEQAAQGELERQIGAVAGTEAAVFLENVIKSSRPTTVKDPLALFAATITMIYSGSHVLAKLRTTLNTVNQTTPSDPARSILARLFSRGVSALVLLLFGVLLVVGTAMEGFVASFQNQMGSTLLGKLHLLDAYKMISTYLLLTVFFTLLLKILPRRRPTWLYSLAGGFFSAIIVGSLKNALDLYMRNSPLASVMGTSFAVLVFFFWLFFSVQAFIFGAEITAMLSRSRERRSSAE